MHSQYVLGIDGGGTKTFAAIADMEGNILGSGLGGSANFDDVGIETAQNNISSAVRAACQNAELPLEMFASVFLGMAGVVSDKDRATIRGMALNLELAQPAAIDIDHDCRIALAGGLSGRPGIVLITGTGSSCYGRTADGKEWRAGGWGYLIADEGSSYWLGLQAMRTAVMAYDGRLERSLLLDSVMSYFGLTDANDIMHHIYVPGLKRSEIAALAPLVMQAALEGDPAARSLIEQGTRDLADCVLAVARQLGFSGQNSDRVTEIALIGGLLKAGEIFTSALERSISTLIPTARILPAELPPVSGACLLALQRTGLSINPRLLQSMQKSVCRLR